MNWGASSPDFKIIVPFLRGRSYFTSFRRPHSLALTQSSLRKNIFIQFAKVFKKSVDANVEDRVLHSPQEERVLTAHKHPPNYH